MHLITILSLLLLVFIGSVSATDTLNDTSVLSDNDDEIVNLNNEEYLGTSEGTFSELRTEIGTAGDVSLTKDIYTWNSGSTISLSGTRVINGNGAVIDMSGSTIQPFSTVTGSSITFKNLTIKNCNYNNNGGAILFNGDGTVENCNFINNHAKNYGGAIRAMSTSSCTVINCSFINNTAQNGGAIAFASDSCTVINSSFINNTGTASYGGGGAIYFLKKGSVDSSNFTNNSAIYCGGAIDFDNGGEVKNSNFNNNTAKGQNGGALFIRGQGGNIDNCNFTNNVASRSGGAIIASYATSTIANCNFKNNTALQAGAVYSVGSVENCNFTDNAAANYGGAIFILEGDVNNCNFINNTASVDYDGGGAIVFFDSGKAENCNFTNNSAASFGGAIEFKEDGEVINCIFTNNSALQGGAIEFYGDGNISKCNFTGNIAVSGSAIHFDNVSSTKSVADSLFLNNRANINDLTITENSDDFTVLFTGNDNLLNAIYSNGSSIVSLNNVYYWGADGKINTGSAVISPTPSSSEAGQNITVIYYVNDILVLNTTKVTDADGKISVEKIAGHYNITVIHNLDDYYTAKNTTLTGDVSGTSTLINLTVSGDVACVNVTSGATGNVTFTVLNEKGILKTQTVELIDSIAELDISGFTPGTYNITAAYLGNSNYCPSKNNTLFTVKKSEPTVIVEVSNITESQTEIINITVNDNKTKEVTVWINNEKYTINDGKLTLNSLSEGIYSVFVFWQGDDLYESGFNNTRFTVIKDIDYYINISNKTTSNLGVNITGKTNINREISGGKLSFILPDNSRIDANYSDGIWWAFVEFDDYGDYEISAEFTGMDDVEINNGLIFIRKEVSFNITSANADYNTPANITISLPSDARGNVTLFIGDKNYTILLSDTLNAKFNYTLPVISAGTYNVYAVYAGDGKYLENISSDELIINQIEPIIVINADDIVVGDNAIINATLPAAGSTNVNIIVNGKSYTVGSGESISIPDLDAGQYDVYLFYAGNENYTSSVKQTTLTVNKNSTYTFDALASVDGEDIIARVILPDDAEGNLTVTVDGEVFTVAVCETINITDLAGNLTGGEHSVNVTYNGDDKYYPSQTVIDTVNLNPTTRFNIDVSVDNINYGEDATVVITLPENIILSDGDLVVKINGTEYASILNNNIATVNLTHPHAGLWEVNVTYNGNVEYARKDVNGTVFYCSSIDAYDLAIDIVPNGFGKNTTIRVIAPEDLENNVTIIIDGVNYSVEPNTDFNISNLTPGEWEVEAVYEGDSNYNKNTNHTSVIIPKISDFSFSISVEDITVGGDAVIKIIAPENPDAIVLVDVDGKCYYVNLSKTSELVVFNLASGEWEINATYLGNNIYGEKSNSTTLEVFKKDFNAEASINQDGGVEIEVPQDATGNVIVTVNRTNYTVLIKNGIGELPLKLTPGSYDVIINYSGDDNYNSNIKNTTITVPKISSYNIAVENTDDELVINLPSDATGNVSIKINETTYSVSVVNGKAVLNISDLYAGKYSVEVTYSGDGKYMQNKNSTTIEVSGVDIIIKSGDVVKYYTGPERLHISIHDTKNNPLANKTVVITINGVTYTKVTNSYGNASLAITLTSGNYTANISVPGYTWSESVNVEVKPTVYGNDIVKVFKNATQYRAYFVDGNGNPLVHQNVSFNINGIFYNRTTNASGWARLNINLVKGDYILTAINTVTGEMKTNNIKVISKIVQNNDVVKYYRNGTQFSALILSSDGTPVGAGREVTFNIHGLLYTRTTDSNGRVKLNINLQPGNYIITTNYEDCSETNSITVLSTLITKDLSMSHGDGSKFVASVLDSHGKPYANQTVSFNINGILYNATSDSNGEARLNINLPAGEYIITSSYNSYNTSNKITVKG